jgi:NAD+ kinase
VSRSASGADERVVVFVKRTSYRSLVLEGRDAKVERLIRQKSPVTRSLKASHDAHEATVREVLRALTQLGLTHELRGLGDSAPMPRSRFVVTVGGDGTLLSASHQLPRSVPIVGINSAPKTSVGFFCAGDQTSAAGVLEAATQGTLPRVRLSRMRVTRNGQLLSDRVLNEALFCHASPAATSRYLLTVTDGKKARSEEHRSSGIWVGPAAGSTAAQRSAGGRILPLGSKSLQFVVREPYTPLGQHLRLVLGLVPAQGSLELANKMHEAKLFLDGHQRAFDVRYGDVLTMTTSTDPLTVLGLERPKAKPRKR